jgi:hypothetical protein
VDGDYCTATTLDFLPKKINKFRLSALLSSVNCDLLGHDTSN